MSFFSIWISKFNLIYINLTIKILITYFFAWIWLVPIIYFSYSTFLISADFYFLILGSNNSYLNIYALLIDINSFFIYLSFNSFSNSTFTFGYIKPSYTSTSSLKRESSGLTFWTRFLRLKLSTASWFFNLINISLF